MKKFLKIIGAILIVGAVYSLIPVTKLYLQKDAAGPTNEQVVERLSGNKGNVFSFIVFGDNHAGFIFNDSAFLKVIHNINRENRFNKLNIDFVANLGDIAFMKGARWDYLTYNKLRAAIKWPVISLMGNHDDDKHGEHLFKEYLGAREFSFSDRNSYFIILDNKITSLSEEQCNWLEAQLQKASAYAHRFVFMHKQAMSLYQQSWFRPEQIGRAHV